MKSLNEKGLNEKGFNLKRITGVLSIVMVVLIPIQILFYVISPPPLTVEGIFVLYQENTFLGLVSMDLLLLLNNTILIFIYVTLYLELVGGWKAGATVALVLEMIGLAVYYPTNPAFEMLELSKKYTAAGINEQVIYLAAGEMFLAGYVGTAYISYYLLNASALLLFAYAVYRSDRFDPVTGKWGLIAGFFMLVPPTVGIIGMAFSFLSLIPWTVFVIRIALRFLKKLG